MQENLFLIKEGKKRESYEKKLLLMVSVLAVLFVAAACSSKPEAKINTEPYSDRQTMLGTYVQIRIYDDGKEDVLPKAFARVKELGDKITVNQPGSEIDEINQEAGVKPVKVSDDLYPLLKKPMNTAKTPAAASTWQLAQSLLCGTLASMMPANQAAEIDQALKLVDYTKVKFNDKEQTVYLEEKACNWI